MGDHHTPGTSECCAEAPVWALSLPMLFETGQQKPLAGLCPLRFFFKSTQPCDGVAIEGLSLPMHPGFAIG